MDEQNVTLETILNATSEETESNVDKLQIPTPAPRSRTAPRAEPEVVESRPISMIQEIPNSPPGIHLEPPSPTPSFSKQRPMSDHFDSPPTLPIKVINEIEIKTPTEYYRKHLVMLQVRCHCYPVKARI